MAAHATTHVDWHDLLTEALDVPGKLGDTYTRFYNYSFFNQVLLTVQHVQGPVATYRRWQELGRQVRKGSKAKFVLAPKLISKTVTDAAGAPVLGENGKPQKRQVLIGFRESRTVFGFDDTDGDELPEVDIPGWDAATALAGLDIDKVDFALANGNTQGYSLGRQVAISPMAAFPTKTLLHEIAHVLLGHTDGGYAEHKRSIAEFQAEATAYLVAKELDLDADFVESRAYIQGWLGADRAEITDAHIGAVFSAVQKILVAGRIADNQANTGHDRMVAA